MDIKSLLNLEKGKKIRIVTVVVTAMVIVAVILGGISNVEANNRAENIYNTREEMKADFENRRLTVRAKMPMAQDSSIPGIVLLNVGDKDVNDFKAEDIHNIFVVIFEKTGKYGRINLVGLQKNIIVGREKGEIITLQKSFDPDNPEKMYQAIEKQIDYKVDAFLTYNNDTVKRVMDTCEMLNVYVQYNDYYKINDVPLLNGALEKYAKQYGIKSYSNVQNPGIQALDTVQMLSYVNLYADRWDCCWNDWRHIDFLYNFIKDLQSRSIGELEDLRKILFSGLHDVTDDYCIRAAAALGYYRIGTANRWPNLEVPEIYKGKQYCTPSDLLVCTNMLHKDQHNENGYIPSEKVQNYKAELKAVHKYIAEYTNKLDAKKRAQEEAKLHAAEEDISNTMDAALEYEKKQTIESNKKKTTSSKKSGKDSKKKKTSSKSNTKKKDKSSSKDKKKRDSSEGNNSNNKDNKDNQNSGSESNTDNSNGKEPTNEDDNGGGNGSNPSPNPDSESNNGGGASGSEPTNQTNNNSNGN